MLWSSFWSSFRRAIDVAFLVVLVVVLPWAVYQAWTGAEGPYLLAAALALVCLPRAVRDVFFREEVV